MCGNSYGAFLPSCPMCGVPNNFAAPPAKKKSSAGLIGIGIVVVIVVVALFMLAPTLIGIITQQEGSPTFTILQPRGQEARTVAQEELVQHALDLINNDRADFGLPPVELSPNQAAQAHAEDVFKTKRISHWMTNGEKPYMTYTRYGGEGSVQQNVAIAGFSAEQYEECRMNILLDCEKIEPLSTIEELEYEMMYKDLECCNDGHKDNILDPRHTHVSIGIVYDQYYLAFVQNFENNYELDVQVVNGQVRISGELAEGELQQIGIYYDDMPTHSIYEQNKHLLSYSAGELVAIVAEPLPPGYYYEKPDGYTLIEANRWGEGVSVNVMFNLASAVREDGVYTLFVLVKDGDETFDATSYSVFVDSEDS
ncbi:MAG TPA: CAP domain-containing protein [Nitrososphaera sp.]|nr:CAP domain-containing protein [Nitrososphaera sp.]